MAMIQIGRLAEQLIRVFRLDRLPTGQVLEDETVNVTYPVPHIGAHQCLAFSLESLDTVLATTTDIAAQNQMPDGDGLFGLNRLRYWHTIMLRVDGVTVSPIEIRAKITRPMVGNPTWVYQGSHVNPSWAVIGPFRVEPGHILEITTHNNGGLGDTLEIWWQGFSAPPGGNVPEVPR